MLSTLILLILQSLPYSGIGDPGPIFIGPAKASGGLWHGG